MSTNTNTTLKKSDVFISYGRAESKAFATKLHNRLKENGLEVWFDQNDIPLGIDFQSQIDDGIEKADNFVFIIAPHSLKSEFCLKEVILAVKHKKRIIPVLHIEPSEKEVWDKMHPTVSALNWVYLRQKLDKNLPQEQWQLIDDFEKGFAGLLGLIQTHKEYVDLHTNILTHALEWERDKKQEKYLLAAEELSKAENWLSVQFKDTLPPCKPTILHAEYICQSKKKSQNGHSTVFFSYAREDFAFINDIRTELTLNGITTWTDTSDIKTGVKFEEAIRMGVEQADNVLFFISPDSVISEYCLLELKYVRKYNKRLIPVYIRETDDTKIPTEIKAIQYLDISKNERTLAFDARQNKPEWQKAIDQIVTTLNSEKEYYFTHKEILVKALDWEKNNYPPNLLLHGFDLEKASEWIEANHKRKINPPTGLQKKYVSDSQTSRISVFISYGRKHSKDFATKLHDRMNEEGYNVWFDQNDIPLGVDFQEQIDAGIENADNFIFIISPHSVASIYCLKEIVLAVNLNKRIIPLLHVDPAAEFSKMHPVIGKLNWIYFQDNINDFDTSFNGLNTLMRTHSEYVKRHTIYLRRSLEWQRNQQDPAYLLVGNDRQESEDWLNQQFKGEQAPCNPTDLHCEFICEAKKNANNMMTEVFFSYAREDVEVRSRFVKSLHRYGITTWSDTRDISKGAAFEDAINEGIEQADNFIFVITPYSVESHYCLAELKYVQKFNKRIIPVLYSDTPLDKIPDVLKKLEWIDFTKSDFVAEVGKDLSVQETIEKDVELRKGKSEYEKRLDELLKILKEDRQYYNQHKVFLAKALKWERQGKNPSIFLRGYNLQNAEAWLKIGLARKAGQPIAIHETFISESRANETDTTTEVFLSYSRANSDFARRLNDKLQTHSKTTWFDQESIASGTDFANEINKGIETSDNFVFVISPRSIKSIYCDMEVEHAKKFNKRFITLLYEDIELEDLNPTLAAVQWIDFRPAETDFHAAFSDLLRTLDTDREHVQYHTKWLQRATEWELHGKKHDRLLRGEEFKIAYDWHFEAVHKNKSPKVTALQTEFIQKSNEAVLAAIRREKRMKQFKRIALFVMVVLFFISVIMAFWANIQREKAVKNQIIAQEQTKIAEQQKKLAEIEKLKADTARMQAEAARDTATMRQREAEIAKMEALNERNNALHQKTLADLARDEANIAKNEAIKSKDEALSAQKETQQANNKAMFHLFVFNAKGLANSSIRTEERDENKKLKALLALTAFDLKREAALRGDTSGYPVDYDPEILEALQKAYFMYQPDNLFPGEAWALQLLNGNNIVFSDLSGQLKVGKFAGYEASAAPGIQIVNNLSFTPNNFVKAIKQYSDTKVVFGTANGEMFIYDTKTSTNQLLHNQNFNITSIATIPSANLVVSVSDNKEIVIWDVAKQTEMYRKQHDLLIVALAVVNSKMLIGVDSRGDLVRIVINGSNSEIKPIKLARSFLYSINYNSKLDWLIGGGSNGEIVIIKNYASDNVSFTKFPRQHKGIVSNIEFSPNNQWMASASFDGTILLWNLSELTSKGVERLLPIEIQNNSKIFSVGFDEQEKYVIFGDNKKLHIRMLNKLDINKKLRTQLGDMKLTEDEWKYYKKGDLANESRFYKK